MGGEGEIRAEGGIERKRRVIQISEITKTGWSKEPDPENVFQDIMTYEAINDELTTTNLLDMGQSQIIRDIAKNATNLVAFSKPKMSYILVKFININVRLIPIPLCLSKALLAYI